MNTNDARERDEIEALLPWHAAGTLGRRDARRVEAALTRDAELADRFALVREELGETIHVNESLGAPSARAADKLFAAIEREGRPVRVARPSPLSWIAERLAELSPRKVAWAAAAALALVVVQAGVIGGLYVSGPAGQYQTASYEEPASKANNGGEILIRFNAAASAAQITRFLDGYKAALVDGPRAGLFRIRVANVTDAQELARLVERMQAETAVVAFAGVAR